MPYFGDKVLEELTHTDVREFELWRDRQAGIANAPSHSGRRSGLTTLAGHCQVATTQRYIDLRPSVIKAAVDLLKLKDLKGEINDRKISLLWKSKQK